MILNIHELLELEQQMKQLALSKDQDRVLRALLKVLEDNCKIATMIDEVLNTPLRSGQTRLDCFIERLSTARGHYED